MYTYMIVYAYLEQLTMISIDSSVNTMACLTTSPASTFQTSGSAENLGVPHVDGAFPSFAAHLGDCSEFQPPQRQSSSRAEGV